MSNPLHAAYYADHAERVVAEIAEQYDLSLVLRFSRERMDPTDRTSVLAGVNRPVIFQKQLDLTPLVMKRLNGTRAKN